MPRYMVHKHEATKAGLHWDLRLEQNGVLKSWAIPKGMPRKSGVRHLAIQTPDHDLSYGKWEGIIPEGSYGAGKVTIDASGEYQTIEQTKKKWKFQCLTGKYKGTWTLIHWKNKQWLIIKGSDLKQTLSYSAEVDEGTPLEDLPEWVEQFLPGPNMNPHYQPLCEQGCYPPEDDNQQCETKDCPDPARTGPMIYSGGYVGKMTLCKICWQGVIEDLEDRYDPETGDFDSRDWWDRDAESNLLPEMIHHPEHEAFLEELKKDYDYGYRDYPQYPWEAAAHIFNSKDGDTEVIFKQLTDAHLGLPGEDTYMIFDWLESKNKRQGNAMKMMSAIIKAADKTGTTLFLDCGYHDLSEHPDDIPLDKLCEWYETYGFVKSGGHYPRMMVRKPHRKQWSQLPRRHTKDAEDDKQVELAVKRTQLSVIRTGLALTTFGVVLWNLWMNKKQAGQIESILDSV